MTSVRGRTRTRRSSGAGSLPVTAAISVAQLGEQRLRRLLARRARERQRLEVRRGGGERVGADRALRRRDDAVPRRRARRATRAARRGRSPGGAASADSAPNPRSMMTGRSPATRMLRGAERRGARCARVQRRDLVPHRVEQRGVDLLRCQLVEPPAVDVLERERHRAVGQGAERLDRRARHSGARREHEQQRFVLDVVLERRRRPVVVRSAQQRGAVAAVQEVGVAAVASRRP